MVRYIIMCTFKVAVCLNCLLRIPYIVHLNWFEFLPTYWKHLFPRINGSYKLFDHIANFRKIEKCSKNYTKMQSHKKPMEHFSRRR